MTELSHLKAWTDRCRALGEFGPYDDLWRAATWERAAEVAMENGEAADSPFVQEMCRRAEDVMWYEEEGA